MFIVGTAAGAVGALLVGRPSFAERVFHMDKVTSFRSVFILYALIQLVSAFLYIKLSPAVESKAIKRDWTNPFKLRSRKRIFTLTALFATDGFGGSLIGASLVAYWFSTKFGLNLDSLSLVFFASNLLSAASTGVSVRLAERIGLLKTMVFTHIPSSVFLIIAAFSPFAWMAILFYQLRSLLSQMDVPPRESYTMAVVDVDERVAMAAIGGVGRNGASMIGPAAGTALWNALGASMPFVGCGVVKISYDILIYFMFRKVKPPEEEKRKL
jgi:predicted MFS family arabinose efflux permease